MQEILRSIFRFAGKIALSFLLILAVISAVPSILNWLSGDDQLLARVKAATVTIKSLNRQCNDLIDTRDELNKNFPLQKNIPGTEANTKLKALETAIEGCQNSVLALGREIREANRLREGSLLNKIVRPNLYPALLILLGILLIPLAIKALLYFVVARIASGRPAVCILPAANGSEHSSSMTGPSSRIASLSKSVALSPSQALLIKPEYVQSSPLHAGKRHQYFLDTAIPISSLLSGMVNLTRIESATDDPIIISSAKQPSFQLGMIELPKGAAFVCHTRSLVGVIQEKSQPITISRHWRLAHLQSWLTMQLRYVVFHGPGTLIITGNRGIRIETARTPRLVNQASTLGFSANLNYSNTRCETFQSYLLGKEALFNDLFSGERGVFVYEEAPSARPVGPFSSLQGFVDAVLKAFGF